MLSAVNDAPVSPTAAGFQVNSGSVVSAEAFEEATAIAAAKAVRLNAGDWKNGDVPNAVERSWMTAPHS